MSIDTDPRRRQPFPGESFPGQPYAGAYAEPARRSTLRRFLGGSPAAVFAKLLFLSILVGAVMAMLGVTPGLLFWHAYDAVRALVDLGLDTFHDFGRWILAGAVVVVPLWLLSRFFAVSK